MHLQYPIQHNFTCTSTHLIYCISCSRCGMPYIGETGRQLRTRFGEHRHAVSANDANQPVARHFNSGSHCISDMKIRALCPISGSNDSRKRQEMRLISKLGTVHPLGINERFSFIILTLYIEYSMICIFIYSLFWSNPSDWFLFVTCCFNIFTCIKTRVLSPTPPPTLIPDEGPLLETSNVFLSPR